MAAVDEIINYQLDPDEDYYTMLNCDEHSSVEQITSEYRALALQYHPDKSGGDKEAESRFQKLQEAKEILCDPSKRSNYNKWRNSGIAISYKQWSSMKDHVQQSMHWATPKTKDRMIVGAGGSSTLGTGPGAARRASEGGAAHWGRWAGQGQEPPAEVVSKFRNYEI